VIPSPEEVIGKELILDSIKKDSFSEPRKCAEDYMCENGRDGKMNMGSTKMEMMPLDDVSENIFTCGIRDGDCSMHWGRDG
jgi:hypothetical protein